MAIIFDTIFFFKLVWLLCRDTLRANNFVDISMSVFCNFHKTSKLQNGRIFGETKDFGKMCWVNLETTCGSKISPKLLYLAGFLRYKHFCVLQFLRKNSKIQNGRHFWQDKIFLKIVPVEIILSSTGFVI